MKKVTASFRCPFCAQSSFIEISKEELDASPVWSAVSECGHCSLIIEKDKDKYKINVPCVACSTPHRFTVGARMLFDRDSLMLQCPASGIDCFFVSDGETARALMEESDGEIARIIDLHGNFDTDSTVEDVLRGSGDMAIDSTGADEVEFYNPEIAADMLFLIKDMAFDSKIGCSCGNKNVDMTLKSDAIKFFCPKCGRSLELFTRSTSDRARLEDMSEILLT
ncbi:MAG: hypothetical protein IJV00_09505 [Clostridia bacterium]|nr:hypothetical protein [Clostridia bacterium]